MLFFHSIYSPYMDVILHPPSCYLDTHIYKNRMAFVYHWRVKNYHVCCIFAKMSCFGKEKEA
jgi:hypothetical protein